MNGRARLAVDIGGTFTDLALQSASGQLFSCKLLTTHGDPGQAVRDGMRQVLADAALRPADIALILHGTTLATNALIERKGAKTALLTTAGHRDVLAMAHEDRFEQYDIYLRRPTPLVPRYLRLPIRERLDAQGRVRMPLNDSDIDAAIEILHAEAVESVAIGYLHAYLNPAHEQRTAARLQAALPDLCITQAAEVCPEIREYERFSTACANAYVMPLMQRYLQRLGDELRADGYACPFLLMTSGGGLTSLQNAARFPIRLVESGPAGGAILARHIARELHLDQAMAFDMGGTTAKLCLLDAGEALSSRRFEVDRQYRFRKGSGLPLRIPVIEMVEIGAGGGSLARLDKLGRVQVGPHSAGSEPGPAAYDRGGKEPTVTDADVLLGRIDPAEFAAGQLPLRPERAAAAMSAELGPSLQLSAVQTAAAISEIVDENMALAARAHAAEFGLDLSKRSLIAFGGAAPLHASRLAEILGVDQVIIPAAAGVGSAVGFLLAPIAYELVRSDLHSLAQFDPAPINALFAAMAEEAHAVVGPAAGDAVLVESRQAYMRYRGQGHELAIPIPATNYGAKHAAVLAAAFEQAYQRLYGQLIPEVDIEVLSWTLSLSTAAPATAPVIPPDPEQAQAAARLRAGTDPASLSACEFAVWRRRDLQPDQQVCGPALITEAQTTIVVGPHFSACRLPQGHIRLTRRPEHSA